MPPRSFFQHNNNTLAHAILGFDSDISSRRVKHIKYDAVPLNNRFNIPKLMGVSHYSFRYLLIYPEKNYRTFWIPKKNGSNRKISAPRTWMKTTQWWILDNILKHYPMPKYIFGFLPNRSPIGNAHYHRNSMHFLNIDIKDFFPSINRAVVRNIFLDFGYNFDVSDALSTLCTLDNALPQGAPSSPALANIVARPLDKELWKLCRKQGLKYSRYADDLTFSSKSRISIEHLKEITSTVRKHGFLVNDRKTHFMGPGDRNEVTGYVVNDFIHLPRKWRNKARAVFWSYINGNRHNYTNNFILGMCGSAISPHANLDSKLVKLARAAKKLATSSATS